MSEDKKEKNSKERSNKDEEKDEEEREWQGEKKRGATGRSVTDRLKQFDRYLDAKRDETSTSPTQVQKTPIVARTASSI